MRARLSRYFLLSALLAMPAAVAPFCASWHWSIDLLACFPVQAMAWLVISAAVLFAARRRRAGFLWLLLAAVAAAAVLPDWLSGSTSPPANGTPLRVLSLNLLFDNPQVAAALEQVSRTVPDVVFCAEVTPAWLADLSAGLPDFPHRCTHADPGCFGVALFSRWPLRDATVVPLGYPWAPAIRAIVETPAGALGLVGVHAPRPGTRPKCEERDAALAALPAVLTHLPPLRIVLGDFNATPWNPAFRAMLAATKLAPLTASGFHPTWPSDLPWPLRIPIDHVLGSSEVGVEEVQIGASFGSDHLPLFAALRLRHP